MRGICGLSVGCPSPYRDWIACYALGRIKQSITHIALVVRDYDEAIYFHTRRPHFSLVGDTYQQDQESFIGNQTGGRFIRDAKREDYGTVGVLEDLYGNLWDLIESSRNT